MHHSHVTPGNQWPFLVRSRVSYPRSASAWTSKSMQAHSDPCTIGRCVWCSTCARAQACVSGVPDHLYSCRLSPPSPPRPWPWPMSDPLRILVANDLQPGDTGVNKRHKNIWGLQPNCPQPRRGECCHVMQRRRRRGTLRRKLTLIALPLGLVAAVYYATHGHLVHTATETLHSAVDSRVSMPPPQSQPIAS